MRGRFAKVLGLPVKDLLHLTRDLCHLVFFVAILYISVNMKIMQKYDIIEFSKIYKRIMEFESDLKIRLQLSLSITFNNKEFTILIPYLKKLSHKKYISKKGNKEIDKINNIIYSKNSEERKLKNLIKVLYLSDILKLIIEYKTINTNKNFIKNLHFSNFDLNYMNKYKEKVCSLRNAVMHFETDKYFKNKKEYLEALGYWERLLFCSNAKLQELPKVKPSIMPILKMLANEYPEIMQMDDRVICDVLDDILFLNGVPFEKYPKYWSIVRQIYEFRRIQRKSVKEETIQMKFEL